MQMKLDIRKNRGIVDNTLTKKIVWREEDRTKVGRGKITHDDDNFVYLTGSKGTVIVNKKDIIAIKQ